tara:strand:- start:3 stop:401 length:399 start_codon:yes stop_codon:yes gene_type:complete
MPKALSDATGDPLIREWSVDSVRHACRCALQTNIDVYTEAAFLVAIGHLTGKGLDVIADDTLMKPSSVKWLLQMCGDDVTAASGVRRMERLRGEISELLIKASSNKALRLRLLVHNREKKGRQGRPKRRDDG